RVLMAISGVFFVSILFAVPASYFSNFGWLRGIFAPLFILYYFIYFAFNSFYLVLLGIAPSRMIPLFGLNGLTYLAGNLLLPDFADTGNPYACFRQVEIVGPGVDLQFYAFLTAIAHLLIFVLQIVQLVRDLYRRSKQLNLPALDTPS
ncbi:MAG TPA: hypothetical protein PKY05_18550, partial [Fibrobacteria bacterium]|nr:hypothetical protein [Fibrobacteria bacterium]